MVVDKVSWPVTDLRVDWRDEDPIGELSRLWALWAPQEEAYVTRALDPASERLICDTLRNLGKDYTILAISHQTALADVADQTYRLEHGKPRKVDRKPD